jgi:hypothetical protein
MPIITLIIIISAMFGSINIGIMNLHVNNPNYICPYYYHYYSNSNIYPDNGEQPEEQEKEQPYEEDDEEEGDEDDVTDEDVTELQLDSTEPPLSNEEMRKIAIDKLRAWAETINVKNSQ